jgi:hypothetical protein
LQAPQANTQTKACKRASTLATQEEFQNFFSPALKKIKTRNRTDQHDTDNDTEIQHRQWFTGTSGQNTSYQHAFGVMRGEVLKFKCSFSNQL